MLFFIIAVLPTTIITAHELAETHDKVVDANTDNYDASNNNRIAAPSGLMETSSWFSKPTPPPAPPAIKKNAASEVVTAQDVVRAAEEHLDDVDEAEEKGDRVVQNQKNSELNVVPEKYIPIGKCALLVHVLARIFCLLFVALVVLFWIAATFKPAWLKGTIIMRVAVYMFDPESLELTETDDYDTADVVFKIQRNSMNARYQDAIHTMHAKEMKKVKRDIERERLGLKTGKEAHQQETRC